MAEFAFEGLEFASEEFHGHHVFIIIVQCSFLAEYYRWMHVLWDDMAVQATVTRSL